MTDSRTESGNTQIDPEQLTALENKVVSKRKVYIDGDMSQGLRNQLKEQFEQ